MNITSIGIIGLGSFGNLAASLFSAKDSIKVFGFDIRGHVSEYAEHAQFSDIAHCDVVILAIPLSAYPDVLSKLRGLMPSTTLLVDVCSVKVYPEQLIATHLPGHKNILLTHPLFGPQTASPINGRELVVTKSVGEMAEVAINFCHDDLGLSITRVTGEEHDKVMAQVHALTFFVAEGLARMDLPEMPFTTPSYRMITNLVDFQQTHSNELFQTVERGNPFAKGMREQLLGQFEECNQVLDKALF